ncbi:DUF4397 domain-containing protein [Pontibacillus salicampi]|uniref:DUF4397 domain-containing protein n=1 Tax=Pontibacillus salicampi TaxID=1449801 RepID=A0ABV6LLJ6_9BACI
MYQNQDYEHDITLKASMYDMLFQYYKYSNPEKAMMYYMKHVECMHQLANLEHQHGGYRAHQNNGGNMQQSYVRVFHASPNAPNVDVYVNGQPILQNVAYKQVSDYIPVMPGDYQIIITPAGKQEAVLTKDVSVPANAAVTLAAAGKVENLQLVAYQDDINPEMGKAKVRFIHLSPDAPNVDIAVAGGDVLFSNVGFTEASDYITIPQTTVDIEVRPAGSNKAVLTLKGVKFENGQVYNVAAVGLVEGQPELEALLL